jgi:hypothetical protein
MSATVPTFDLLIGQIGVLRLPFLETGDFPMLPQDPLASGVWRLLEELYLLSASKRTDDEYSKLSEAEKQKTLLAFANAQVTVSKRWAAIVADVRSLGITG